MIHNLASFPKRRISMAFIADSQAPKPKRNDAIGNHDDDNNDDDDGAVVIDDDGVVDDSDDDSNYDDCELR